MLYWLAKHVTYLFVRIAFSMRYEGLENIPKSGGYVVCSNHQTFFDPVFLCHKIPGRMHFMAKAELFRIPLIGFLFKRVGAFPIARGEGDRSTINMAVDILKNDGVLLMFPEGTRSKTGKPLRPRSGVALISGQGGAGVLPISIDYENRLKFRRKVTLKFHPVLTHQELAVDPASPSSMRKASKMVMASIVDGLTSPKEGAAA